MSNFEQFEKNFGFGTLNKFEPKYGDGKSLRGGFDLNYNQAINYLINDKFKPNAIASITEYVGYVIYNKQENSSSLFTIVDHIVQNLKNSPDKNSKVFLFVRIPELHTLLPIPKDENDIETIKMYPIFSGVSEEVPSVGDLVRVKFSNMYNQTDGIYLGPFSKDIKAFPRNINESNSKIENKTSSTTPSNELPATSINDPDYDNKMKENLSKIYRPFGRNSKNLSKESVRMFDRNIRFSSYKRKVKSNMIVIHESIEDSITITENSLIAKNCGVHFAIDQIGNVFKYNSVDEVLIHEPNVNNRSIGIEFLNCIYNYKKNNEISPIDEKIYNSIGNSINSIQPVRNNRHVLFGDECVWIAKSIRENSKSYVVPNVLMLEAGYKLIKNLCITYNIPIAFPAVNNNDKTLRWGKQLDYINSPGIVAHKHGGEHSDGLFIEHYVICRFNDFSMKSSYDLTIENAKKAKNNRSIILPGH